MNLLHYEEFHVPPMTGKLADPKFRTKRATKASRAAHSPDTLVRTVVRRCDELSKEHKDQLVQVAAPTEDDLINILVRRAPALTDDQTARLRPLLASDGGQ